MCHSRAKHLWEKISRQKSKRKCIGTTPWTISGSAPTLHLVSLPHYLIIKEDGEGRNGMGLANKKWRPMQHILLQALQAFESLLGYANSHRRYMFHLSQFMLHPCA